jgi:ankyrin repeat protein
MRLMLTCTRFLLARIQLENILHEPTAGEIADALRKLSGSLPEAFNDTIGRIHQQHPSRERLGMSTIMWVSHAKRKLNIFELSQAISVSPERLKFDTNYIPSADVILECCQGLVWIDTTTGEISFIHSAVQDYLDDFAADLFPSAEEDLGATCLRYLMLMDFKDGPKPDICSIRHLLEGYKFLPYASSYWGQHIKEREIKLDDNPGGQIKRADDIQTVVTNFLHADHRNAAALSNQIREFSRGRKRHYWRHEEAYSVTSLHMAAGFGLCHTLQTLLESKERINLNVNQPTKVVGSTAIILAASGGHVKAVQLLFKHGAEPGLRNWYGNAMHCAAEAGQSASIQELIACGMEPNIRTEDGRLPLSCTLDHDEVTTFETLVRNGADVTLPTDDLDHPNGPGYSILHEAVSMDCVGIVNLILRNRWVEAEIKTHWGQMPMHLAACRPHATILKRLLEADEDVNVKDDFGHTPLFYAQKVKANDAVAILLQKGAVTETDEAAAISRPSGTAATDATPSEDVPAARGIAVLPSVFIFWNPLAQRHRPTRRVKQEIAREGILPWASFFAASNDPPFARRQSSLSDRSNASYHTGLRNDYKRVLIAATVLVAAIAFHRVFEVSVLVVSLSLPPDQTYNFLTYSFIIVSTLAILMVSVLLYLKTASWLRRRPANHEGN